MTTILCQLECLIRGLTGSCSDDFEVHQKWSVPCENRVSQAFQGCLMTVLCVWFLGVALETLIEKGFYCHAEMHAEEYALDDFLTPRARVLCHHSSNW